MVDNRFQPLDTPSIASQHTAIELLVEDAPTSQDGIAPEPARDYQQLDTPTGKRKVGQQTGAHIGFELFGSLARSPDIFPRSGATATELERYPLQPLLHLLKSRQARGSRAEIDVA